MTIQIRLSKEVAVKGSPFASSLTNQIPSSLGNLSEVVSVVTTLSRVTVDIVISSLSVDPSFKEVSIDHDLNNPIFSLGYSQICNSNIKNNSISNHNQTDSLSLSFNQSHFITSSSKYINISPSFLYISNQNINNTLYSSSFLSNLLNNTLDNASSSDDLSN
jgi:hypothetical protein